MKPEHIQRMEQELKELKTKITNGQTFLDQETKAPKFTDDTQRELLFQQLSYMKNYAHTLSQRIKYDLNK